MNRWSAPQRTSRRTLILRMVGTLGMIVVACFGAVVARYGAGADDGQQRDGSTVGRIAYWVSENLIWLIPVVILVGVVLGVWRWLAFKFHLEKDVFVTERGLIVKNRNTVRYDRLQGVNLTEPLSAKLFGLTKVVIEVAGERSSIELEYLRRSDALALRKELLSRASGASSKPSGAGDASNASSVQRSEPFTHVPGPRAEQPAQVLGGTALEPGLVAFPGSSAAHSAQPPLAGQRVEGTPQHDGFVTGSDPSQAHSTRPTSMKQAIGRYVDERVGSIERPEGADLKSSQSLVKIPLPRIIGASVVGILQWILFAGIPILIGCVVLLQMLIQWDSNFDLDLALTMIVFPIALGMITSIVSLIGTVVNAISQSMNYRVIGTEDGVLVSSGLFSTVSATIPPGRVHAVQVRQPLMWRMFGWWQIKITKIGQQDEPSSSQKQAPRITTVVLPVGTLDDVSRIVAMMLPLHAGVTAPEVLPEALSGNGRDTQFHGAPRRGQWLRLWSWRRTGWRVVDGVVLLRTGVLARNLSLVPAERLQGVSIQTGPVYRLLRLVSLKLHTVPGPVNTTLPIVDRATSVACFDELASLAVAQARLDTSHRWADAAAQAAVLSARFKARDTERTGQPLDHYSRAVLEAYQRWEQQAGGVTEAHGNAHPQAVPTMSHQANVASAQHSATPHPQYGAAPPPWAGQRQPDSGKPQQGQASWQQPPAVPPQAGADPSTPSNVASRRDHRRTQRGESSER